MPSGVRRVELGAVLVIAALVGCSGKHQATGAAGDDPFRNVAGSGARAAGSKDDGKDDAANLPGSDNAAAAGSSGDPATGAQDPAGSPQGTTLPHFPGSGTSNAGDPLPNGMLCDAVAGDGSPIPERIEQCYFDKNDPSATDPAATLEQVLECVADTSTVHIRLTFHPWFVDNTYGDNSVGWHVPKPDANGKLRGPSKGGHSFNDLVESDHAEITLTDANGAKVMQFKLDYLSADPSKPSGYGSLGVLGGEGAMIVGDAADIVRWSTSEDLNLNDRGYASYTSESPATDMDYTPNPDAPEWDYRVVYEAWVDIDAFGAAGFGGAEISFVHASPSKADSNTVQVKPGDCPCNDPDGCHKNPPPPPPTDKCGSNDPDNVCGDAGLIDSGTPTGGEPVPEMVM